MRNLPSRSLRFRLLIILCALALPGAALACGGLFCNNNQPVNQAAERILFAKDGQTVHMHVQLRYQGPAQDFGWLLPVPKDVEVGLGTEALFAQLDANFGPQFRLTTEFGDDCAQPLAGPRASEADGGATGNSADEGVNVLSREAVGPYDTVVLTAESVQDLRDWLDTNEFQIPEGTDPLLKPYVEAKAAFVALKLLPGTDEGDVQPVALTFSAQQPVVPIVPTAVAANPDMGIIVHVLGEHRAIPKNYAHVVINEGAIDWIGRGSNYSDVVSQAADEANGKAFTTDYAGEISMVLQTYSAEVLRTLSEATTLQEVAEALGYNFNDADLQRTLGAYIEVPEGVPANQFWGCVDCFGDVDWAQMVDGAAIAAQIEMELNPAREQLNELIERFGYITRLYTTMSAHEMTVDPLFSFNPDLEDVPNIRTATRRVACSADGNEISAQIELASGAVLRLDDGVQAGTIQRQDGATVRGQGTVGAQVIEQMLEAGPSMVIEDRSEELMGGGDDEGCDCSVGQGRPASGLVFGLLILLGGLSSRRGRSR